MKSLFTWLLLAAFGVGMTGCVAQQRADDLQTLYRKSQDQVMNLKNQLGEANAQAQSMQQARDAQAAAYQKSQSQLQSLQQQQEDLQQALAAAKKQLNQAGSMPMLPQQLNHELEQLAAAHPNLMSYDSSRGMVKLSSDLTFDLGSAMVSAGAKEALDRLASVLNSAQAKPYDVRIAGYTDNVPISNPATKAKFPNNWYLSAGRAIAVENVLQQAGVDPHRMGVAGYSMYRPIVPYKPGGTRQNRRVEIFLVPHAQSAGQLENTSTAAQGEMPHKGGASQKPAPDTMYK